MLTFPIVVRDVTRDGSPAGRTTCTGSPPGRATRVAGSRTC